MLGDRQLDQRVAVGSGARDEGPSKSGPRRCQLDDRPHPRPRLVPNESGSLGRRDRSARLVGEPW